jgi:hypothetical protein
MSALSSFSKIGEALAVWLNPDRRERATLLGAIEAASELLKILRKQGRYQFFNEKKLKEHEEHYQKRFDAWKDGAG